MKNKNVRFVEYVVGSIFCFPIVCVHIIPEEESVKNPSANTPAPVEKPNAGHKQHRASQQGVKRVCGNSQKSVRMKHKKN